MAMAMAMTAHGASSDPGKTAVDFLEKVRLGKIDLEPGGDTALSPQTASEKKLEIAKRLERIAHDLGSDPLEVSEMKLDENYAAVLVRKIGGYDPSRMQVFPVALIKRGTEWSAAPVPASFENAGAGYAIALRKRIEALENWMLREQVLDLEKLREQSNSRMRQKIQASLSTDELRKFTAVEAGMRFAAACEQKDLPAMLGLLGGLSTHLPNNWPARLKAADIAVNVGSQASRQWRLMTAPEVLRVPVQHEETKDSGLFSLACLDPAAGENHSAKIEIVHFDLSKSSDGLWRIDPSDAFLQNSEETDEDTDEDADADLADELPAKWRATHPATPQPSAGQARDAFITSLRAPTLASILGIIPLKGEPAVARKTCMLAAQVWWTFHDPFSVHHAMPLAFRENESAAVGLFQFFSARDPDRADLKLIYFEKSDAGWQWTPEPRPDVQEKLKESIAPDLKRWTSEWQQTLLSDNIELKSIPDGAPPTTDEAQKVVEKWLQATRSGDVTAALQLTARLSDANGVAPVLRNLGHEILSGRQHLNAASKITGVYEGKIWTAVGMEISQGGKATFPLYPVIQTAQGPRILIEIDLFSSRASEYLNKMSLDRLRKFGSAAAADDLRALFSSFQTAVKAQKP